MKYYEDIIIGDTREFGSYQVTEKEIIEFASKYDPQIFHLDPILAKKTNVGGLIASGWHTCAIFMRMFVDNYLEKNNGMASPGVDELKWIKPVYPNDTLSARITIKNTRISKSRPNIGIIKTFCEVINQDKSIVMTLTTNSFSPLRN